jgi:uncharacterized membrane protein YhiD involved in acid resistance
MDEWIKQNIGGAEATAPVDIASLVISLLLAFCLVFILAKLYIHTHHGYSYSKSFVHTIVFVGITIDLIMIIIGSNIARAFALVGAMSIVRFRNPVKDSRDLIFLFMAMAVGMATGTQFYFFAIFFTGFASLIMLLFHYFDFGETASEAMVLKVKIPEDLMAEVESVCGRICKSVSVIAIDRSGDSKGTQDVIFEVELAKGQTRETLLNSLMKISDGMSVNVLVGESSVSV